MKVQVDTSHYDFLSYVKQGRWNSYYQQIFEVLNCDGKDVLYIGAGDGIVTEILKKYGKNVKTLDFDKNLKPDYVGSVTDIKKILGKNKFDVIICCQVLEHIPFSEFENTIKQLCKCSKEALILSLPNHNRRISFSFSIPKIKTHKKVLLFKNHLTKPWDINKNGFGEHYWEIDAKGCPTRKTIKNIVKKYFASLNFYTLFENPYHMFFILKK